MQQWKCTGGVECRTEAVQKAHRAEPCPGPGTGTMRSQALLDGAQKDMQHGIHRGRFALQEVAQAFGER